MSDAVIEQVFEAMLERRVDFKLEPICDAWGGDTVMYRECLSRVRDSHGCVLTTAHWIAALTRAARIGVYDRYVVRRAMQLLRSEPGAHIGVNVCAQSIEPNVLWQPIFEQLGREPELAKRLVVEITEGTPLPKPAGRSFVRQLRELGCRVAVDDFGEGYSIQTARELGVVDIVKLDASWLRKADDGQAAADRCARLEQTVSLASLFAPQVVIEGVESQTDLELARVSGASWVQGYLFAS